MTVFSWLKLSDKPLHALENLAPLLFFGVLIILGYGSVVSTVYMLVMGEPYIGNRPDIISKQ